jgi:hypothetical protein
MFLSKIFEVDLLAVLQPRGKLFDELLEFGVACLRVIE